MLRELFTSLTQATGNLNKNSKPKSRSVCYGGREKWSRVAGVAGHLAVRVVLLSESAVTRE